MLRWYGTSTLNGDPSVEPFFNVGSREALTLFENLSVEFLEDFDVFAPSPPGRTREPEPPVLIRGILQCSPATATGFVPLNERSRTQSFGLDVAPVDPRGGGLRATASVESVVCE